MLERLKPSKLVEPRSTATKTSVPVDAVGAGEPRERPANDDLPSRTANGAIRASNENATAKPSPNRVHASRPYTAIPASAQYV